MPASKGLAKCSPRRRKRSVSRSRARCVGGAESASGGKLLATEVGPCGRQSATARMWVARAYPLRKISVTAGLELRHARARTVLVLLRGATSDAARAFHHAVADDG